MLERTRLLAWDGCLNARDLGGYPTRHGGATRWGAVVRSDYPGRLSASGQDALRAYGIRTIVDLRLPHEVDEHPHPFADPGQHGLTYAHRSFIPADAPLPPDLDEVSMLDNYIDIVDRFQHSVGAIMQTIASASAGGVLVHCAVGKDRTGLVCGMLLDLAGVDRDTIGADYAMSEKCLAPEHMEWLENGPGDRQERERFITKHSPRAEVIVAVLEHLDTRHGGTQGYLDGAGLVDHELDLLRSRLLG